MNEFATNNKLGLALDRPSKQTIIPVLANGNGNIEGFYTITATTFQGTETTFALADGTIPITSVTLPKAADQGTGYRVNQYMAHVIPASELRSKPWLAHSAFVNTNDTGYGRSFSMATYGSIMRYNRGVLITNLMVSMATSETVSPDNTPPVAQNAAIRWAASIMANSTQMQCGFFDFQWVNLFRSKTGTNPLRIETVTSPAGGEFKSTLVASPVVLSTGAIMFDTVRIIRLKTPAPGLYNFVYNVIDVKGLSTQVTLALTIV